MIVFDLQCAEGHQFESWFKSSEAFEAQRVGGLLACPFCGHGEVGKAMMAPAVGAKGNSRPETSGAVRASEAPVPAADAPESKAVALPASAPAISPEQMQKAAQLYAMMRAVQTHVEENFDHVGDKFVDEARAIHYGETEERAIYGQASPEDAEELQEEGIDIGQMPWLPKLQG